MGIPVANTTTRIYFEEEVCSSRLPLRSLRMCRGKPHTSTIISVLQTCLPDLCLQGRSKRWRFVDMLLHHVVPGQYL